VDLSHYIGSDISVSASGDLLLADSLALSQQSVLRRLLTNPGDYIWHPDYGAGLPKMVGSPIVAASVQAVVQSQMLLEPTVARNPLPVINVTPLANGMFVQISYYEIDATEPTKLAFNVKN